MHGLLAGRRLHKGGEAVHGREDQPSGEVAGQAHDQHPQGPPRRDPLVVVADGHHHHVAGEQLGLRVVDEDESGAEGQRSEHLPEPCQRGVPDAKAVADTHDGVVHDVEDRHDHAGHGRAHEIAVGDHPGHPGLGLEGLEHGGDELLAWEKCVLFGGHWLIMALPSNRDTGLSSFPLVGGAGPGPASVSSSRMHGSFCLRAMTVPFLAGVEEPVRADGP